MADLTVKQKQIFNNYKKTHPKMSDAEILSALVNLGEIQLSEDQQASLFFNSSNKNSKMGLQLEHSAKPANNQTETVFLQSGRKIVITKSQNGKEIYKYYSADGTQLKPDYFKQKEGVIKVSSNRKTYTVTKNGNTTIKKAKDPLTAKIDQQQAILNKTKNEQGFIGKSWDWFKNKTGIGDGSGKAQKQIDAERALIQQIKTGKVDAKKFEEVTGVEYSKENLQKFKYGEIELKSTEKVKGYQEGQDMACDVAGDIFSGIAAVGIYSLAVAAAPFTGGASIVVGVGAAALSGAAIKSGIKALDATTAGRKYSLKDFGHDFATGAFSGLLAPITGGMGGAVGKTVATKLGIQAVKSVGKEVTETVVETGVKQGLKTALINPTGYEYVGGTLVKRATAMATEMATDGALGGAIDGGFRAGLDNDWDANAMISGTVEGGIGGALMAPIIGGGFKVVGKGGHKLGEKIKGGKGTELDEVTAGKVESNIGTSAHYKTKKLTERQYKQAKKDFEHRLRADKDFPKGEIPLILRYTNEQNIDAKLNIYNKLSADKDFPKDKIPGILKCTNEQNISLAEKLCADKDSPKHWIWLILDSTNEQNIDAKLNIYNKLSADKDFPKDLIPDILYTTNEQNIDAKLNIYNKLSTDKDFPKDEIPSILRFTNEQNLPLAEKLFADKEILRKIPNDYISKILAMHVSNTDDTIIRMIKDGTLENTPKLLNFDTDCWENIIERDLLNNQVSFLNEVNHFSNDSLIPTYAKCKNKNIVKVHQQLLNDALANKDILKSGVDDITDADICKVFINKEAIRTLDLIGVGNTEAAFPLMLDEFSEFVGEIGNIKLSDSNRELVLQKINPQNSQKYAQLNQEITNLKKSLNEVIGKDNLSKIQDLQKQKAEIDEKIKKLKQSDNANTPDGKKQLKELQQQSKSLGSQIQSIYCQSESAKALMNDINTKSKELKNFVNENAGIEPQEVVTKMRVLAALTEISTDSEIAEFIEMIKPSTPENDVKWNEAVNRKIFQKLNIEFDEELSKKLDLINCKYISKLFISSNEFFTNMQKLVYVIKNNPELTIEQAIDMMPQNIETKRIFDELGFDYNKFTKVDKNSYTSVEIKLNAEEAKQMSIHNLEEDLNDALFQSLPKDVTEPIFKSLEKELGVTFVKSQRDNWVGDGFDAGTTEYYRLFKNGKPITFEDMDDIVNLIKKEILSNDFWTTTNADANIDNIRRTMYTHLIKMRTQEVDNAISIKDGETAEIEIRKTDMYDIKKALGLGNDAQCCTALGRNGNEWSAPTYIMNKCIGAIELTDKNNFVGNTMIYLAYVDGKPALVLDNIELKTKYQNNDKIRDTFVEYAKKLCEEIGQPDLPIFAGPNRHKLNMDIYPKEKHSMKIIGNSGEDYVYVDYDAGRHIIGNGQEADIYMYKLR